MRQLLTLVVLCTAFVLVSCGTGPPTEVTAPAPDVPELDRMEVVYTDPALPYIETIYSDGVVDEAEWLTLRELSAPAFTVTIGTHTWCWKPTLIERHAQWNQWPPDYYDPFPMDLRGTTMPLVGQYIQWAGSMTDATVGWGTPISCGFFQILWEHISGLDAGMGFFMAYLVDVQETGRFGMFCPSRLPPWCGYDFPNEIDRDMLAIINGCD